MLTALHAGKYDKYNNNKNNEILKCINIARNVSWYHSLIRTNFIFDCITFQTNQTTKMR